MQRHSFIIVSALHLYLSFEMPEIKDKEGKAIHVGDTVAGKRRGGKQTGEVDAVVSNKQEAEEKGVKGAPKVLFEDQHGMRISPMEIIVRTSCYEEARFIDTRERPQMSWRTTCRGRLSYKDCSKWA
jgi:Hypervirulence associated proteins TUDOR domain